MSSKNFAKSTKKIEEVKEVIQNKPDLDIIKVLEVFDNDVGKTINAFLSDGGKDALSKFNSKKQERKVKTPVTKDSKMETNEQPNTNNNQNNKKSPNKKKSTKNTDNNSNAGRNNINDLVSSIINQSITTVPAAAEAPAVPSSTDNSLSSQLKQQQTLLNKMNNLIISSQNPSKSINDLKITVLGIEENQSSLTSSPSSMSTTSMSPSLSLTNKQSSSLNTNENITQKAKIPLNNQFANSNHSLTSHINKSYTNQNNIQNPLDKSQKDLQRQTTVLAKIATQFQDELNKSQINMNQTFMQLRNMLDQRQNQLQASFNSISRNGSQILIQRQQKAAQLKTLAENVVHLNDQDTLELKADIKHFVSERQLDEEFSKVKIFNEDNYDMILESINNFGKISQLNVKYAKQRPPLDEVLNNSFSSSPKASPLPQRQSQQISNKKAQGNVASNVTNGKQINGNVSKPVNGNGITNGNQTKKFSIPITDVNDFSDDLEDEGDFIELKPQKNKKKQQNKTELHQNGSNGIHKETIHQNGWQTQTNGHANSNGTVTKKQKNKKNAAKNENNNSQISKANVNPYRLLANGFMD